MTETTTLPAIRRYTNRKMYDPTISSYVNLTDLTERVRENKLFSVLDVATGQLVTHQILAQIAVHNSESLLTADFFNFLRSSIS